MTESLRAVLARGVRTLHDGTSWSAGPWCTWCNMFIGEHLADCPYAALASALARLEAAERRVETLKADQRESDLRLAWVELEFHPDWPLHEQMVAALAREETPHE